MTNTNQDLKKAIMNRVLMVYIVRRVLHPRSLTAGWLLAMFAVLFWFVSVLDVLRNFYDAAKYFGGAYGFVSSTFLHTSLGIQAISLGIIAAGVVVSIDLYRTFLLSKGGSNPVVTPNPGFRGQIS